MNAENKKIVERLSRYHKLNTVSVVHCGSDNTHQLIDTYENSDGDLKIRCYECGWEGRVPLMFYEDSMDESIERLNDFEKNLN